MRLEWEDDTLYRVDGVRREIGYVQRSLFGDGWEVFVRRKLKHILNTREAARKQLEAYGNDPQV